MKKTIILWLLLLLLTCNLFSQIGSGQSVSFSTIAGEAYNPGTHDNNNSIYWVTDRTNEELSPSQILNYHVLFETIHPGHIILDEATTTYNCQGYSFGMVQGTNPYNIYWTEDLCQSSFVSVTTPQKGDIAVMRHYNSNQIDSPHSAWVYDQDTLISKWGDFPLTKHHKDSVINLPGYGTDLYYTYYRRVINTNDRIYGPAVFNGMGTYYFDHNDKSNNFSCTWSVEPAAMFQVSSGTGTTANLNYATPFVYLAPKATLTFTFNYGCDNHYTATKEIDLRIPTTTVSGTAVSDGFILDTNAVVTITGQVNSNKDAKTIVPVGTKLVLDGGTMTGNGNVMWGGIEVWGNTNTHQYAVNGSYGQGYLELKNGAVIENAICAVDLWRPDYWSTTGGIINASDASFLNNTMAVHALCYRNFKPLNNNEADYNAVFNNCEFVVDRSYLGMETFKKHINIADVRGVRFNGCDFSADRSVTGVDPWCLGINAYDASFVVKAVCNNSNVSPCPANDYHQSTFSGFCAAVRAGSNGNHPRGFTVRETLFANNDYGVYATNTDFPLILQNEFTIGGEDYCRYNYGVYLKDVASFCIEENEFSPSLMAAGITYGIAIYDSQGINDVYLNQFTNLTCGNLAKGANTGQANGSTVPGLTYSCNTNTGNDNDFVVLQDHGNGGIQPQQGSFTMPAGNTFGASDWQFYNGGTHTIDYYNNSTNTGETPSSSHLYHVTTHGTTSGNYCYPHYGNDPVEKSSAEKAALASDYFSAHNAYLATQMSEYAHEYTLAAGDIVRSNLNESEADPAELREWLGKMNDITADRMVVSSYIHEGDSSSAFALAKTLPNKYGLYGDDLADHADYLRLMQLYQTLYRTNRTVYQLADSEKGMVDDIANNGTGISKSLAETLIEQITGNQRGDCIDSELPSPPNSNRGELSVQKTFVNNGEGFRITIIPNPASTWAVVDYKLPADKTEAVVEIYNSLGAKVMSVELVGSQGQRVLDFRHLAGGVYTYNLRNGEFVKTGKLVIAH